MKTLPVSLVAASMLTPLTGCPNPSDPPSADTTGSTDPGPSDSTTTAGSSLDSGDSTSLADGTSSSESGDPLPADDALELAAQFLGGAEPLLALGGFELVESGQRWIEDEGEQVGEVVPASEFTRTVSFDLSSDALRIDNDRILRFLLLSGIPQQYPLVINGDVGAIGSGESALGAPGGDLPSDRVASTRREQRLLNPLLVVREALADPSLATEADPEDIDGRPHRALTIADAVAPLTVLVDAETGAITRLRTLGVSYLRRDVPIEVDYRDWEPAEGGLMFPGTVELRFAGMRVLEQSRTSVRLDPEFSPQTFSFPPEAVDPQFDAEDAQRGAQAHHFHQAFASIGIPFDGLALDLDATELAPGVTLLSAGAYTQLLVEQQDGLVLTDAPLYPERADPTLAWIEANVPGRSVTHAVMSHFHQDHVGGARSFVAEGAALVVGPGVEAFWRDTVFAAPSTIRPDRLSMAAVTPEVIAVPEVDGTLVLDDPERPVRVHHISQQTHSADMVLTAVDHGGQRFVFVADIYGPGIGSIVDQGIADFIAGMQQHDILDATCTPTVPTTVVGAHGGAQSFEDMMAFVEELGVDLSALGC